MKFRIITTLCALLAVISATAQTPDNDLIFEAINNNASPYYYPNLMMRYQEGDTMTTEEYHHLYYCYA